MAIRIIEPPALGKPVELYSHGVIASGRELVVVSGQIGMDAAGRLAGDTIGPQTRQAFANIAFVLAAAGCAMSDLIRLQVFLIRPEDIEGFLAARRELFPGWFPSGAYPPASLLVVSRLLKPQFLVEIEAMAVRPDCPSSRL
jgi:2-iminobutanoate/2-iminopropanoate deaminase